MRQKLWILLISVITLAGKSASAQQATHPFKEMETELLKLVNDYRKTVDAKPLKPQLFVANLAERHSHDMAAKKVDCGNEGFKERTEKIRAQLKPVYAFAENVACGKQTAKDVLDSWMASEKYKRNLEGDYNYAGIGIEKEADSFYVTCIFILR